MNLFPGSPYVNDLLARLAMRDSDDASTLQTLALRTLDASPDLFLKMAAEGGEDLYLLGQFEMALLIADSGFDDWFDTQWLALDSDGSLTADRPLQLRGLPTETPARVALGERTGLLAGKLWREHTFVAKPMRGSDGRQFLAFRAAGVGSILARARTVAQSMPAYQELTAGRKVEALRAELFVSHAAADIPYSESAVARRPRWSPR